MPNQKSRICVPPSSRKISRRTRNAVRSLCVEALEARQLLSGNGLTGTYFNNQTLTGQVISRIDPTVNFDWGNGSPDPAIGVDHFSARWSGQVQAVGTGVYTFYTGSDDGVRLWVNGQQIINDWTDHAPTSDQGNISLVAGQKYNIRLEYYEGGGGALCNLAWSSPTFAKQIIPQANLYSAGNGLSATYFSDQSLITPVLNRLDTTVNFNWGTGSPAASIPSDRFSARWSGQVQALTSEVYTFSATTDDGERLWVNGQRIINDWADHTSGTDTGTIALTAGQFYSIRFEYYEHLGNASCVLGWSTPTIPAQIIPTASLYSTADTTAPSTPTNLAVTSKTDTTVSLSWTASTDNVGVAGYTIYRGSAVAGSVASNATTFTDTGLTASTTYSYKVVAIDGSGNVSPASTTVSATTSAPQTGPQPPIAGTWNLKFDDEFNTLNTTTWATRYWWNGNNGTQATFDPKQLSVSNGVLSQTAINQPETSSTGANNPYTSGLMTTGDVQGGKAASFTFTYGYVESRAQIAPGQGMWSALWMLPADHNDNYELDIYENLGRLPTTDQGFYHMGSNFVGFSSPAGADLTQGFHTYGVDWEPDHITWYLDGKAMYTTTSNIVNRPMYMIMNLDVGGPWAGPLNSSSPASSSWKQDYLRVWQH